MDLSLVYISQGNIPSRWAHTIQTMRMSEALACVVRDFCLLTQASGSGTKRPEIDFLGWYGIREPFRIVQLPGARPNRAGYFEKVWYPDFDVAAVKYCSRLRPDLVYTRSPNAGRLAVTAGIPTIVEAHGDIDDPQFKHLFGMIGEQAFLGVVTITPELQRHYADAGVPGEKIRVFPDAVDVEAFANPGPPATWRREFGVDDAAFVATYCGHLYKDKGIDVLLECAALPGGTASRAAPSEYLTMRGRPLGAAHRRCRQEEKPKRRISFLRRPPRSLSLRQTLAGCTAP